ncbi:UrcA family protein [Phenylobacterium sp.]|uniref:UrcA family protein n=1 Tax=Phenylobacterium sp. TaxID=1871053 RepID=UPI0028996B3C|nr:UrcA family protein [Phenylobacterium sp.]
MIKFSSTLAGLATIALAAVPALALATGAQAAPVAVKVSDININAPRDAHILDQRVAAAAAEFCSNAAAGRITLSARHDCLQGARAEIQEQLAQRQVLAAAPQELAQR